MDGDSTLPRKRRRPPLACEQCRARKIRCDQKKPCDQCIRSRFKSETCTYLTDIHAALPVGIRRVDRTHQTKSSTGSPATNDNAFDVTTDQSPIAENSTKQIPQGEGLYNGRIADSITSVNGPNSASSVHALLDRVQQLEKKLSDSTSAHSAEPAIVSQSHNERLPIRGSFSKSMFFGQSHWMNIVEKVRHLLCTSSVGLTF